MDGKTLEAFDWALKQQFQSVAARYARTLAEYIRDTNLSALEREYPEWKGKFHTMADAVLFHIKAQNAVIKNLRDQRPKSDFLSQALNEGDGVYRP